MITSAYRHLCDPTHIRRAWLAINKRKQNSSGLDGITIKQFADSLEQQIKTISEDLKKKTYRFSPVRGVILHAPGKKKPRPIKIPDVRDRVVLKAIALIIEPIFSKYNLDCSYGYIKGKGVQDAISAVRNLAAQGYRFVLEADMQKFFDTVDRPKLIERFKREIKRPSLLPLISQGLEVELGNLDKFTDEEQKMFPSANSGIPQGGVLSPMLANFYLYPFDKAMMEKGYKLVRYADDFVIMCKSLKEAQEAHKLCEEILQDRLGLRLHPLGGASSKTRIFLFNDGLNFLGTRFAGGKIAPAQSVISKFESRIRTILDVKQRKSLLETLNSLKNTILGWGQCYRGMDVLRIFSDLDLLIKAEMIRYLREQKLLERRYNLNGKQLKFLGVPSLVNLAMKYRNRNNTPPKTQKKTP